jgi:hypothetical protein
MTAIETSNGTITLYNLDMGGSDDFWHGFIGVGAFCTPSDFCNWGLGARRLAVCGSRQAWPGLSYRERAMRNLLRLLRSVYIKLDAALVLIFGCPLREGSVAASAAFCTDIELNLFG